MDRGLLTMSASERERAGVVRSIVAGQLLQREGVERLGICVRQMKRLVRAFRADGDRGLVSRHRGRTSPLRAWSRALPTSMRSATQLTKALRPFSLRPTGTLLSRHLAQFVAADDRAAVAGDVPLNVENCGSGLASFDDYAAFDVSSSPKWLA